MVLALGIIALLVVVGGVAAVLLLASRQAREDHGPRPSPPISSPP